MKETGNNTVLKLDYNTYKHRLTYIIRKTKNKYYSDQIEESSSSKSLWNSIKKICKDHTSHEFIQSIKLLGYEIPKEKSKQIIFLK